MLSGSRHVCFYCNWENSLFEQIFICMNTVTCFIIFLQYRLVEFRHRLACLNKEENRWIFGRADSFLFQYFVMALIWTLPRAGPQTCRKTSYIHVLDRYVSSFPVISKCRGIRFAVISRKLHKWNFLRLCLGLQNWITKGANLEIKGKVEIKMYWKVYMIIAKIGK